MIRLLLSLSVIFILGCWISLGESMERFSVDKNEPLLLSAHAYRAALPAAAYDINRLVASAQQAGFSIRLYDGKTLSYYQGTTLCTSCTVAQDREFMSRVPALYVDGGLFLLRIVTPLYRYTVRPSPTDIGQYEIAIQPMSNIGGFTATTEILQKLVELDVISTTAIQVTLEEMTVLPGTKLPKVPDGIKLDSALYGLSLMPDWHEFASTQQIDMWGLRVRTVIELNSATAELSQAYNIIIEARSSSGLVRALIPVHSLSEVARDPAIKIIRPQFIPRG